MNYTQISAMIPFYSSNGENSTCIILNDGSRICEPQSVKIYIDHMIFSLHLDPRAIKYWTSKMIGNKLNNPLVIDNELIFLPVKFRQGIGKHDGCVGYINMKNIQSFDNHLIVLCNGEKINNLSSKSYIEQKQRSAQLLSYLYIEFKKKYEFMWKPFPGPSLG